MKDRKTFRATKQTDNTNLQENDTISVKSEIDKSVVQIDHNDSEGVKIEMSDSRNGSAYFIPEQIKQEPIDIKDEPKQEDVEMDDDDDDDNENCSYDNKEDDTRSCKEPKAQRKDPKRGERIPNKCYVCDTVLERESDFFVHLECHRHMLPYVCAPCSTEENPIKVSTLITLNNHFERHSFSYVCSHCPLRFRTCTSIYYHVRHTHGGQKFQFKCEPCQKQFSTMRTLQKHKESYQCIRNTEKSRQEVASTEMSEGQILQGREGRDDDPPQQINSINAIAKKLNFLEKNETAESNTHNSIVKREFNDNGYNTAESSEINESNNQSTIVKIEPNYSDGEEVQKTAKITDSIQAQIKREPIDIKDELSESNDDETTEENTSHNGDSKDVETIQNKCYICDIRLESRNDFDEHLESHKNMLPYNCSQCSTYTHPIVLSSLTALNKHFKRHDYDYLCPQCPLRYRTFKSLKFHIRYSHENQTQEHHCETCRRVFTNRPAFRKHIAVHRNLTTQRYKCDPCKKCFTSGSSLLRHQRFTNHSNSEEHCGSRKGKSSQFKGPTLRRRDPKGVDRVPNKCYVCDTVLERESDYYVHLESHRSMLPYVCSQCSTEENCFKISTLITLNNHFERHSFNYTCPHCPLQYRTCTSLHHHIRHAHRGQNSQ